MLPVKAICVSRSEVLSLSLEISYDVVLIFKMSTPGSCYRGSLFKELLRNTRQEMRTTNYGFNRKCL